MLRQFNARYDRNIARPYAAYGKIDACRRLRAAADADKDNIGVGQIRLVLTIIMLDGKVERFHPFKITRVHLMLSARPMCLPRPEEFPQGLDGTIEDRYARHAQLPAFRFQRLTKDRIDQSEENDPRIGGDMFHCPMKLHLVANQRTNMLADRNSIELRTDRLRDCVQRFPCRIGNQMQMIFASHDSIPKQLTAITALSPNW